MILETTTFRLVDGADEAAFLAADATRQADLHRRPGLVRRTLARGDDGRWLVITLWWTLEQAVAAAGEAEALAPHVAEAAVERARWATLD